MIGRRQWSIRTLLFAMIAVATVPPILIALAQIRGAADSGRALLATQLDRELEEIATAVRARWVYRQGNLILLANNDVTRAVLADSAPPAAGDVAFLRDLAARTPGLDRAVITDGARVRLVLTGSNDVARNDVDDIEATRAGALDFTVPIADGNGTALGELQASVSLSFVLPAEPRRSPTAPPLLSVFDSAGRSPLATPAIPADLLTGETFDWTGRRWLVRRRVVGAPALSLVLAAPLDPFVAPFQRAAGERTVALAVGSLLALGLAALLASRLSRSVQRFAIAADEVAQGRIEKRIDANGTTEIRRLSSAFNAMTSSLHGTLRRLAERESLAAVGEFAASLAHEIRNPLTAIRVDLQHLARHTKPEPTGREALGRALRQVDRLDRAVSAALELARGGQVRMEQVALEPILRDAIAAAEPEAARRGARITRAGDPAGPHVCADAAALHQLLLNVLLNAAQAVGDRGTVRATTRVSEGTVEVEIADDGPGIPPDQLPRVFDPFYTTRAGGTGLGLAVARRIAIAHGGQLVLESTEGKGTTATIRLRSA